MMTTAQRSNNKEIKLLQLQESVKDKLAAAITDSPHSIDDILSDLSNEELALVAAKVNSKLNCRLNSELDF